MALAFAEKPTMDAEKTAACIQAALDQQGVDVEVLVVDARGGDARLEDPAGGYRNHQRLKHLPGTYKNRAAMYNAALNAATGDFFLAVYCLDKPVVLKRSAAATMLMAATRFDPTDLVYSDYERIDADGARNDVHLLDWHEGRLRDTFDLGSAILYRTAALREVGGFDEQYAAADLYDVRLKLGEKRRLVHVANRYSGSAYAVYVAAKAHSVFDYLLDSREAQIEMEQALTEHLKRVGAYLGPRQHEKKVPAKDDDRRSDCVASVVIPVNNRPQFIGRAIESVQAQTVSQVEAIVVVNGGPDDPTIAEVQRYLAGGDRHQPDAPPVQLIVVDMNNLGLCLNSGLAAANGLYYVQLDSDDRLKPEAVEKLIAVFDSDPTVGMVVGSYEVWNLDESGGGLSRDERIPVVDHAEWTEDNGRNNLLRINGAGAPRSARIDAIADVGWFGVNDDPHCRNYGEDYDLVLRMSENYRIGRVWDPIYEVIRHSGGTDHSIDQATIDRNDNAKDHMRLSAIHRRKAINAGASHG